MSSNLPPTGAALRLHGLVKAWPGGKALDGVSLVDTIPGIALPYLGSAFGIFLLAVFASTDQGVDWSVISAATLITAAPLLIAFLIFQRQFIKSFMRAGIR